MSGGFSLDRARTTGSNDAVYAGNDVADRWPLVRILLEDEVYEVEQMLRARVAAEVHVGLAGGKGVVATHDGDVVAVRKGVLAEREQEQQHTQRPHIHFFADHLARVQVAHFWCFVLRRAVLLDTLLLVRYLALGGVRFGACGGAAKVANLQNIG